jgi:hypothetical protein
MVVSETDASEGEEEIINISSKYATALGISQENKTG